MLQDWIFIGKKKKQIDLIQVFINTFAHITELLNLSDKYGYSFGPKAFHDWADDIKNGRFDGMTEDEFDSWRYHSVYICNLATNFCGVSFDFLSKAKEIIPDLADIYEEYSRMNEWDGKIGEKLQNIGGGFNITLAALQDKERRTTIANEIRKFAPLYENFAINE